MPPVVKVTDQQNLVSTKDYKHATFPFEFFNVVQSRAFEYFDKDFNAVIASKTSSGKTITAEIFMAHAVRVLKKKAMYLAPLKALAQEKYDDWTDKSHHFSDLNISICTGDYRLTKVRIEELNNADIIIMSSEMLNHRSRNQKSEQSQFLGEIGALCVDECFPGNTRVTLNDLSEVCIEEIYNNESIQEVLAYDEKTNSHVSKKIIRKIKREKTKNLVKVTHENGSFVCTEDHKIWTETGYKKAIELSLTDKLKYLDFECIQECLYEFSYKNELISSSVVSVERHNASPWVKIEHVYDLEVEDCHNYFVNGTLVSNCHLLTVKGRGDHLEAGLMKFTEINPECKLILLSATMPNVGEIADWCSYILNQKETFLLTSDYRPCPLNIHYEKYYDGESSYEDNQRHIVEMAEQIIEYYPEDKFLVFAHTKRTGEMMKQVIQKSGKKCEFHNADLTKDKRLKLEKDFKEDPDLKVVIATSTLAWGCYAKGTQIITKEGLKSIELIKEGDLVYSMTDNGFDFKKVLRTGVKYVDKSLEFETETGEKVIVSEDHEFYGAIQRNNIDYYKASEFHIGDYVSVPNNLNDDYWINATASDEGYLIGYCFGDGCKSKCGKFKDGVDKCILDIAFGASEKEHIKYIEELIYNIFNCRTPKARIDSNGVYHIQTKKRKIVSYIPMKHGRHKSSLSFLQLGLNLEPSFIKGVLQGLFDSDGGFSDHSNGNTSIEFTTISKVLANEVQQYLLYFGVRSSVGKKKVKDTIINGRMQVARRKFIYRVRIYNNQIVNFVENIGFRTGYKKNYSKYYLENLIPDKQEKNVIPARKLLLQHAEKNNISPNKMLYDFNISLWNCINRQDIKKTTCEKIIKKYEEKSGLNDILNKNIRFVKIKSITEVDVKEMYDLEIEDTHNYIGGGIISHNCNLPARRVIILGVHRGLTEVETYDIFQMFGRAGRPAFDPIGDAYLLLPEKNYDIHKSKMKSPQNITSQMLDNLGGKHKVLAFHLLGEIYQGSVKDKDDVYHWYKRSLAAFQSHEFDDVIVDGVIDLLRKCGAIWEKDGKYSITSVGKVSSMFYYSPFDVSDLKRNLTNLFDNGQEKDDYALSFALGNVDTQRCGICSRVEREEMGKYSTSISVLFPSGTLFDSAVKAGYGYYLLMNGQSNNHFSAICRSLQFDFARLGQVLQALDGFGGKWGKKEWFKQLQLRITYGVKGPMVYLCQLPNVGKVRATKLWNSGIKSLADVVNNPTKVRTVLGLKDALVNDILAEAKNLL